MEWDASLELGGQNLRLRVSAATDVGNIRAINEDSYLAAPPVFLVADGMGGHAHGDRASSRVVEVFVERHGGQSATSTAEVVASIRAANSAVRSLTEPTAIDLAIAGTTLTGVAIVQKDDSEPPSWMAFNLGDSRVYRWDAPNLEQLTVDHSAVQELVDRGDITPEEAEQHPERNIVTRAIGVDDDAEADVWLIPGGGAQCFLLCSDGLTKELSDARIAEVLMDASPDGTSIAQRLVAAALASGGNDNVTAVVVEAQSIADEPLSAGGSPSVMPAFLEETMPRN
ncbi:MAG TPA: protein phosphatase 2C domain-containing protein [Galbitalea sp.]|nr:protein phosphatase 2C domain-containing protein [Galbitalea sp.]